MNAKTGWILFLVWLGLTAATTFIVLTFGDVALQLVQQIFGFHLTVGTHMTLNMYVAVALICAFQSAMLTAVGAIFWFVISQMISMKRDFDRMRG